MFCKKKYSQKELLVFKGFTKLVDEGIGLTAITVSDIAKAAGIGKGTVYEYFESKDEVIAKSIMYKMETEFEAILEKSNQALTFEDKCKVGFREIIYLMTEKCAYFQILMTSKEIHHLFRCLNEDKDEMIAFRDYILEILNPVIDLGIKEGIINSSLDRDYIRSVFISVNSGLSTIVSFQFGNLDKDSIEYYENIAYTILMKALS